MLARIMYYPSLAYNLIMSQCSSRKWYNRIDETVILGALPLKSVTDQLVKDENVKAMVTMNEDYEMKYLTYSKEELSQLGIEQLHLRTVDMIGTPTLEDLKKAVSFILLHRSHGNSVYVHCKAGRTRSTAVVTCYLIKANNWTPEKSYELLKSKRPHVWVRSKQWASIQSYYDDLKMEQKNQNEIIS